MRELQLLEGIERLARQSTGPLTFRPTILTAKSTIVQTDVNGRLAPVLRSEKAAMPDARNGS